MSTSPIPKVRDDDPEDVSWALSTAATSFARGDRAEALKWLRRAAEAASEAEHDSRALELAKAAADLSATPPPPATTPKAPAAATAPQKSAPTKNASKLQQPKTRQMSSLAATRKMTQAQTKLPPKGKTPSTSDERTDTDLVVVKPVATNEADAWPTEANVDLDSLGEVYGTERTRIGAAPYKPEPQDETQPSFRASQAVRVVVWRGGGGELRIAPFGTRVSAVTIEALLVAPGPDVDLLAWLSPA